ncbi:MAG: diaminopimelate epimerase [Bacteroidales bacterium]|nr:diaminopimelate epimerase [Bacteroidales bacterium]
MKRTLHFTKMQGAGNDYIYIDATGIDIPDPARLAVEWSDRNKGIGGDGLVLIAKGDGKKADFSMRIFNADGSEADMCGNAARCIGKYLYEKGLCRKTLILLQTASGIKNLWIKVNGVDPTRVESVTVDMLEPAFECREQFCGVPGKEFTIDAEGRTFKGMFISMGNPHFVTFVTDAATLDVEKYGAALEKSPVFPRRCNIEFATVASPERIVTRVWERGSCVTKACGTGACATAVAASLTGRASKKVTVAMDGGDLEIDWNPPSGHVYLSGPAEFVFEGNIEYGTC